MYSTANASTNTPPNGQTKNGKEKDTGFFKRLFGHEKEAEESSKAEGTP
jgi:hypothetical protein